MVENDLIKNLAGLLKNVILKIIKMILSKPLRFLMMTFLTNEAAI